MTSTNDSNVSRSLLRTAGNLVACVAILGAAVAAIYWINSTEPIAEQVNATRKSSALVETIIAKRDDYAPRLVVLGTVQPAQEIVLSPRVSGTVIELSPNLVPGGMVKEGDLLLRIDPADFQNALAISQSELQKAEASLEIELARQSLAEKELELLEGTINEINRALVLREPQIASIRAEISAAKAAIERANLDLQRANVIAPFDAQILSRSINIGSQVGAGDELAQLVGVQEYWVTAAVPVRSLRWVQFPNSSDMTLTGGPDSEASEAESLGSPVRLGSLVKLRDPDSWQSEVRQGRVSRMIGRLDNQTRLARVLVTIPDPLGLKSGAPPLILNSLIETAIEGKPINNVVRLDRGLVRDQDRVWIMKDNQLEIRQTEVVFRDAEFAYISEGIEDGDELVVTTLATVADGIGLRRVDDDSPADEANDVESGE
ncbi:MAG: efflux RND transporter periplasmic adaptor subunit [Planctomycetota bacterium]